MRLIFRFTVFFALKEPFFLGKKLLLLWPLVRIVLGMSSTKEVFIAPSYLRLQQASSFLHLTVASFFLKITPN